KSLIALGTIAILIFSGSCKKDEEFLNRQPTNVLSVEAVWKDPNLVLAAVGDLYDRYPDFQTIERWVDFTTFDEAFASNAGDYGRHQNNEYGYGDWGYWDYTYIRDINLFIQRGGEPTNLLDPTETSRFLAEARFIRAGVYFEMVKRMGGVPLILTPLTYDYSGNASALQFPRAKESEVYDFIIKEMEEIKNLLPADGKDPARASKGAALAMEARAALYAGSIAKHGASTPEVSLPGGEVGIPASMANGYYTTALRAAQEIISSNVYSLYTKNANLQENFASLFTDKANPEVIFVKDFKLRTNKAHGFTIDNQPRSIAEEAQGGRINPSLNLVQSFERLDNTFASLPSVDATGNPVYYNNASDIFTNRDARLWGTVMLPGTSFKGKPIDIWAGYQLGNGSVVTGTRFGETRENALPGISEAIQVVGGDGPLDGVEFSAQTGFYIRKYMDPAPGSGQIGTRSEVWWIRYRFSEVLLNAAEAAFELGDLSTAAGYMKQVRDRAGLTTPLTPAQITFD
ncbi:MAG TPA: RagB/SusD family nutrient uptake outer membrane protein, partial [Pedobacter sp.]